jgi:hypothetical protein
MRSNVVGRYARWVWSLIVALVVLPVGLAIVVLMFVPDRHRAVVFWPAAAVGIALALYQLARSWGWYQAYRRLGELLARSEEELVAGRAEAAERLAIEALREVDPRLIPYVRAALGEIFWRRGALEKAYAEELAVANTSSDSAYELQSYGAIAAAELRALAGDVKTAEILLDWVPRLVERAGRARFPLRTKLTRARAILEARRGNLREAQALFASIERAVEEVLSLPKLRATWLVRAWVESAAASPRDGLAAERWLARLRAVGADDLAAYASGWPELRAFLDAQGLTAVPDFR